MASTGYLQVHAYASNAQLPLKEVAIVVTAEDQTALAMRLTDQSGLITPIEIPVPDLSESQSPDAEEIPYTLVNLTASLFGYEHFRVENIQIFANTTTNQDLEMVPLSDHPSAVDETVFVDTLPQDL